MNRQGVLLENATQNLLEILDTNGSPNPGQDTRLSCDQQEETEESTNGLFRLITSQNKVKGKRKTGQTP